MLVCPRTASVARASGKSGRNPNSGNKDTRRRVRDQLWDWLGNRDLPLRVQITWTSHASSCAYASTSAYASSATGKGEREKGRGRVSKMWGYVRVEFSIQYFPPQLRGKRSRDTFEQRGEGITGRCWGFQSKKGERKMADTCWDICGVDFPR